MYARFDGERGSPAAAMRVHKSMIRRIRCVEVRELLTGPIVVAAVHDDAADDAVASDEFGG